MFAGLGFLSFAWFLVRVLPKPSRAAYPCQRAAAPLASSFVMWLVAAVASVRGWRLAKLALQRSRFGVAAACAAEGCWRAA
jgi:hypothetical protein